MWYQNRRTKHKRVTGEGDDEADEREKQEDACMDMSTSDGNNNHR